MKATLEVNKAELLKRLEARVEEIRNAPVRPDEEQVRAAIKAHEEGEAVDDYRKRVIEYHTAILEGLENGTIDFTDSGRMRGRVPDRPKKGKINYYTRWDLHQLKHTLTRYEEQREAQVRPLLTAIDLLSLTKSGIVEIDAADYQALLAGQVR